MDETGQKLQGLEKELENLEQKPAAPTGGPAPVAPESALVTPPAPLPASGNKSKKVLWLAIGFLALSLIIAGVYFLNQGGLFEQKPTATPTPTSSPTPEPTATPDPTADWKIYRDDREGIEFKYPPDWYATPYTPSTFSIFLDSKPIKIPEASEFITPIHVGYNEVINTATDEKSYSEKTLAEGIKRFKQFFDQSSVKTEESLTIGGKEAVRFSGKLSLEVMFGGEYFEYTLVQMDNKLLVIQLNGSEYQEIYNQILSTFQFTE